MTDAAPHGSLTGLVPMIHVTDVEASAAFYRLLGLEIGNRVPPMGDMEWAWLYSPAAPDWKRGPNLMLTKSDCPLEGAVEGVVFYLYASDLEGSRRRLLHRGVEAGEITYPEYLPDGEFCVKDPDGYTLMVAQSAADTP